MAENYPRLVELYGTMSGLLYETLEPPHQVTRGRFFKKLSWGAALSSSAAWAVPLLKMFKALHKQASLGSSNLELRLN
jgi:hypothetical protein